ncbi:hypothetical protein TNCV_1918651 [Trichonephila clavipes]|nr:hypothetical protein TNCV_1918651 [Trichonephila clavipes]
MGILYHTRIKATVDGMATSLIKIKAIQMVSKHKIMATLFWVQCSVLLVDLIPQGTTINSGVYCATLRKLQRVLQDKRCSMLSKGVLLLHDKARPHSS